MRKWTAYPILDDAGQPVTREGRPVLALDLLGPVRQVGNPEDRVLEFIGSTEDVDRYQEVISVSGWDLKQWRANPVFQWAHLYKEPPIGTGVKVWKDTTQEIKRLMFHIRFLPGEVYDFAEQIYQMYLLRALRATSVGFLPFDWEENQEAEPGDMTMPWRTYLKQELLELSAVPVPANPFALATAFQKGLVTESGMNRFKALGVPIQREVINLSAVHRPDHTIAIPVPQTCARCDDVLTLETSYKVTGVPDLAYCWPCTQVVEVDLVLAKAQTKASSVQSVICAKKKFKTLDAAKKWVTDHNFRADKVDETDTSWRFRQFDPSECADNTFATITLAEGVQAVICTKKAVELPAEEDETVIVDDAADLIARVQAEIAPPAPSTPRQMIVLCEELPGRPGVVMAQISKKLMEDLCKQINTTVTYETNWGVQHDLLETARAVAKRLSWATLDESQQATVRATVPDGQLIPFLEHPLLCATYLEQLLGSKLDLRAINAMINAHLGESYLLIGPPGAQTLAEAIRASLAPAPDPPMAQPPPQPETPATPTPADAVTHGVVIVRSADSPAPSGQVVAVITQPAAPPASPPPGGEGSIKILGTDQDTLKQVINEGIKGQLGKLVGDVRHYRPKK